MASSHAPGMYVSQDELKTAWDRMLSRATERGTPIPAAASKMTVQELTEHQEKFREGHAALRRELERYNPDALIIIGGDQDEMFDDGNRVNLLLYTGAEASGTNSADNQLPVEKKRQVHYKCDTELARFLLNDLVAKQGFDVAASHEIKPFGKRKIPGIPHPFVNIAEILPRPDLPVVLFYENTYDLPSLITAKRCYDAGAAMANALKNENKRVAIPGSGGLSHDPFGPRNIWIDEPLDRCVLSQIEQGKGRELSELYRFDSMVMREGTGEIRAWVTVAGAMEYSGAKAKVVDYIPAHETQTGCAFAYWRTQS